MLTGVGLQTLYRVAAFVAGAALGSAARALFARRGAAFPKRAKLLAACLFLILEHPQSAGVLLLAAAAAPVPIVPVAYAAFALSSRALGLLVFLPLAALAALASLAACAVAAAAVCWLSLRRLRGEPATLAALLPAMRRHYAGLRRWLRSSLQRPEEVPYNPFLLPALLSGDCDWASAAQRAAAFVAEAPEAAETALPLQRLAAGSAFGLLALFLPMAIGFFCLPLASFMGYSIAPLPWGIEAYALAWALFGAALCGAIMLLTLLASAALAHAGVIYAYGTGGEDARRRALKALPLEWVWPAEAAAGPIAPTAAAAPIAPAAAAPAPAPGPAAPPEPAPAPLSPPPPEEYPATPALPSAGMASADLSQDSYARESVLPQAKRLAKPIAGPEDAPRVLYTDDVAPRPRPRLISYTARALWRFAILAGAALLSVYIAHAYDGYAVGERLYLLRKGAPVPALVLSLEAAPKGGALVYRLRYEYESRSGPVVAEALVSEAAPHIVARGQQVAARVLEGPPRRSCLEDDYGFGRQRLALILVLTGVLLIGAWSFVFRVM